MKLFVLITFVVAAAADLEWINFSKDERVDVQNLDVEKIFVRYPCDQSIWFKLFMYSGEADPKDDYIGHVELWTQTHGNVFCKDGGDWTEFTTAQCECDAEGNIVFEFEKTASSLTITNEGTVVYSLNFDESDGSCLGSSITRIITQVWGNDPEPQLAFLEHEDPVISSTDNYLVEIKSAAAKSWYLDDDHKRHTRFQPSNAIDGNYDTFYSVKDEDTEGNFLQLTLEKEVIVHEVRVVGDHTGNLPQRIVTTNVMVYNGDSLAGNCDSITEYREEATIEAQTYPVNCHDLTGNVIRLESDHALLKKVGHGIAEVTVIATPGPVISSAPILWPAWPTDFTWSHAGMPEGDYGCIKIIESAHQPGLEHTWTDNYFCWDAAKADPGFRWGSAGQSKNEALTCINTNEPESKSWEDNYFCFPTASPYDFVWSCNGPIEDKDCIQWEEPDDAGFEDNFLCA